MARHLFLVLMLASVSRCSDMPGTAGLPVMKGGTRYGSRTLDKIVLSGQNGGETRIAFNGNKAVDISRLNEIMPPSGLDRAKSLAIVADTTAHFGNLCDILETARKAGYARCVLTGLDSTGKLRIEENTVYGMDMRQPETTLVVGNDAAWQAGAQKNPVPSMDQKFEDRYPFMKYVILGKGLHPERQETEGIPGNGYISIYGVLYDPSVLKEQKIPENTRPLTWYARFFTVPDGHPGYLVRNRVSYRPNSVCIIADRETPIGSIFRFADEVERIRGSVYYLADNGRMVFAEDEPGYHGITVQLTGGGRQYKTGETVDLTLKAVSRFYKITRGTLTVQHKTLKGLKELCRINLAKPDRAGTLTGDTYEEHLRIKLGKNNEDTLACSMEIDFKDMELDNSRLEMQKQVLPPWPVPANGMLTRTLRMGFVTKPRKPLRTDVHY